MSEATKLAIAKLAESGLDARDAKRLHLEPLEAQETLRLHPAFRARPGLRIPYFTPQGKPLAFYRLRYLGPAPSHFGERAEKDIKYVQPPDTGTAAYFTPGHDWKSALAPKVPLFVTEGEFKAACACKHGINTIGLGGVFNFQSAKAGVSFLPELRAIDWVERTVNVVFDSDYATNPNIRVALSRFLHLLIGFGARPRVINLPTIEGQSKTGLDDFLVAHGLEAFTNKVAEATETEEARTMWAWNDKFAFVKDPGIVVDLATAQQMRASAFEHDHYRHHRLTQFKEKSDGTKSMKERSVAAVWLEWPQRFELDRITYSPGQPTIVNAEYNLWRGWGCEAVKGDVGPWKQLLDHLFAGDTVARTWFERWCAYPLQHPGTKLYSAVVLWSLEHGIGKSIIGETLGKIYGPANYTEIGQDELMSEFTEWLSAKQFIFGDDITGTDSHSHADKLKKLITQEKVRVNQKHIPVFYVPDHVNFLFTTNKPNAFLIEDHDRRYFIWRIVGGPLAQTFYDKYKAWKEGVGPSHLRYHLEHLDLGDFAPRAPALVTTAKTLAIDEGRTDAGSWLADLRVNLDSSLLADLVTANQLLAMYESATGHTRLTVNGLSRELTKAGVKRFNNNNYVYVHGTGARYWILRNEVKWLKATADDAKKYLEAMTMQEPKEAKY